jgi:CxxC motif-containing protein
MNEQRKMTCILCPVGCEINVGIQDGKIESISGNTCKRGEKYATTEVTDPRRTLTTTVRVSGGSMPLISVKSASPLPKNTLMDSMRVIAKTQAKAPIKIGDVVVADILGTGIDIIATSCADLL